MASTWKQSITTSAGIALMNKAYGVSSIIPTKAVTITDNISGYSVTQLMALTSVNYNQSRVPIVVSNQANTTRIGIDIDNKDVNEQYDYYGIGVYFKQVNTGEEVLFSVIPLTGAATIIPNQSGVATSSISIDSYTSIVPGIKVDLSVSDSGSVTRSDVEQIVAANQSYSFPKKPAASGIDFYTLKSIGIYQIKDDKTVVNAPDGFSGNGYIIVIGDGTTANPITQDLFDTVTGNKYSNSYDSDGNKWTGWEEMASKSDVTDLNRGLSTKVTDNKNGTEQINGVQVQPFNKLSDSVGGRNYLTNTQNPSATNPVKFVNVSSIDTSGTVTFSNGYVKLSSAVSSTSSETYYRFYVPNPTSMPLPAGTYTLIADLTSSDNVYVSPIGQFSTNGNTWQPLSNPIWKLSSTEQRFYYTFTIPSNATGWFISLEMYTDTSFTLDNTGKYFQFINASIQKGNVVTDSSPAPEDKVNVSDMRKPASDVAGIEEVNAKADDSKVAHLSGANNFDTVPTVNNNPLLIASSLPSDLARTGSDQEFTGKNTFDTAPIDKKTGNPYITKDGVPAVPSTLADTTKDANFTGKLQQAGSDVITQSKWVESDSDAYALSSSKSDTEGFYYTEEAD